MKGKLSILSRCRVDPTDATGLLRTIYGKKTNLRSGWSVLRIAFLVGLITLPVEAQDSTETETPAESEDPSVIEKRKTDLFRRSSESHLKRAGYPMYLEENARQLQKALSLDEAQTEKIDKLTEQTFEQLIKLGIPAIKEQFARYSETYQKARLADERASLRIVHVSSIPDLPDPLELEMWTKGLSQILGKKIYSQWKEARLHLKKQQQEEDLHLLKEAFEFYRERDELYFENFLARRTSRIFADLSLEKKRQKQIETTAEKFTDEVLASVQEEAIKEFEKASPIERQRLLKSAGSRSIISQRPESESDEAWTKALTPLLTPEELAVMEKRRKQRKDENTRTVALLAFLTMDRFLRFDEEQEAELLPAFEERIRARVELGSQKHCTPLRLSTLVSEFKREDNRKLLEPHLTLDQKDRLTKFLDLFSYTGFKIDFESPSQQYRGEELTDDIEKDLLVGSYMTQRLDWERSRRILPLLSRIEEMDRAGLLEAADKRSLEIAAKGAVTREIEPLNERLPDSVLLQIDRVLKGTQRDQPLRVVLNLLPDNVLAEETAVWKEAIVALFSPKALAEWDEMERSRLGREQKILVDVVLSETDHEFCLSEDQRTALQPLLEGAIEKYLSDFRAPEIFSRNWFESYSGGVLFCLKAIPEQSRDKIFTKKQREFWKTKYENRFKSAWENIEQRRGDSLKKEEEEKKAKKFAPAPE